MNNRTRMLYLLGAALCFASCQVGPRYEDHIERQWPASGVHRLSIREVDGSVQVEASQSSEISLTAHVVARGIAPNKKAPNDGYFDSDLTGDALSIGRRSEVHIGLPIFRRNDVNIEYVLKVPATVALTVHTVNGRVASRGIDGETQVMTVNGPIDIESAGTSELEAHTVNGGVTARFLKTFQGASLKTVNGRVEATLPPSASFACDLSQVNGDFEATFPLNIHSHPGSRRVSGDVNGGRYELRISTVNGDIRLENGVPPVPPVPGAVVAPPAPQALPALPAPPAPPAPPTTRLGGRTGAPRLSRPWALSLRRSGIERW